MSDCPPSQTTTILGVLLHSQQRVIPAGLADCLSRHELVGGGHLRLQLSLQPVTVNLALIPHGLLEGLDYTGQGRPESGLQESPHLYWERLSSVAC